MQSKIIQLSYKLILSNREVVAKYELDGTYNSLIHEYKEECRSRGVTDPNNIPVHIHNEALRRIAIPFRNDFIVKYQKFTPLRDLTGIPLDIADVLINIKRLSISDNILEIETYLITSNLFLIATIGSQALIRHPTLDNRVLTITLSDTTTIYTLSE